MEIQVNKNYLFEVSWEVCNKRGGTHTILRDKGQVLTSIAGDKLIFIGPDLYRGPDHPEFKEDPNLFSDWVAKVRSEGYRIRVGRWAQAGNRITILCDFTTHTSSKDNLFTYFWEKFKLDSISGQWDYIESFLFGYVSGAIIESFIRYNSSDNLNNVASFHDWFTGSGILYLRDKFPYVATLLYIHQTVIGKEIVANNLPLWGNIDHFDPMEYARIYGVQSKFSLEKLSVGSCDVLCVVSDLSGEEVEHFSGKHYDFMIPNGINIEELQRSVVSPMVQSREKLFSVADSILGYGLDRENTLLIGLGGKNEFRNKGIDVFLQTLSLINDDPSVEDTLLVFLMVPAPCRETSPDDDSDLRHISTHEVESPAENLILLYLSQLGLSNDITNKVKVIYVPSVLNGSDGVFNLNYLEITNALDSTVYPSYYESWGHSSMESIILGTPTIISDVCGVGQWLDKTGNTSSDICEVIVRSNNNDDHFVHQLKVALLSHHKKSHTHTHNDTLRTKITEVFKWNNIISKHITAIDYAVKLLGERNLEKIEVLEKSAIRCALNSPNWERMLVRKGVPEKFSFLEELSMNIWWSWTPLAKILFDRLEPKALRRLENNPLLLLRSISSTRWQELEDDQEFLNLYNQVKLLYNNYMAVPSSKPELKVAYFSMEYGLENYLRIYSGGLGILAGDYIKEASDEGVNLTAIGLFYKYGYFTQKLSSSGEQNNIYTESLIADTPITPVLDAMGKQQTVIIFLPGRDVTALIWLVKVGRVSLYLLDTDTSLNSSEDRAITATLYGGDNENRLKQEMLLGIGGIRVLRQLGIEANVYHCNEGHAAFNTLERLSEAVVENKLLFSEAVELVRSSSLFTTHTPVPAGHDTFTEDQIRAYLSHYLPKLKCSWEHFISLGRTPYDKISNYSMSHLAVNLSSEINGVSKIHGDVSKDLLHNMWKDYFLDELNVGYVTNGVHYPTWCNQEWQKLHKELLYDGNNVVNKGIPSLLNVPNLKILEIRNSLREALIKEIKAYRIGKLFPDYYTPKDIIAIQEVLRPDVLTIGFARRFATYKRATLLFRDKDRLRKILNNPTMPVQIIFAGKAHPHDKLGQSFIKEIVAFCKEPDLIGKILFIENYDMNLAKKLVSGVDVWMNTPLRLMEASGTSGQKAAMNGVPHLSVLDGWWVEGYGDNQGWAIPLNASYTDTEAQNELDSEILYNLIEEEIAKKFYNADNHFNAWVSVVKNTFERVAPEFTTTRMITDYINRYYTPLLNRNSKAKAESFSMVKSIAKWKQGVALAWSGVDLIGKEITENSDSTSYARVFLNLGNLSPSNIKLEAIVTKKASLDSPIESILEFSLLSSEKNVHTFGLHINIANPGLYTYCIRLRPASSIMFHHTDMKHILWI